MASRLTAVAVALLLSGCAALRSLPPETRAAEITWQSLHGIDALQTLAIARDPDCYMENGVDPFIGKHPSEGMVVAWAVVASVLHYTISYALVNHPKLQWVWQGITIGSTGATVIHNAKIGIRPFGHNEPHSGACGEPD